MSIRKLIREELEVLFQEKDFKRISYLSDFELIKNEKKNNSEVWLFEHNQKNYTLRFYIEHNNIKLLWSSRLFVYWRGMSKELTNSRGKDLEFSFGPFEGFDELVSELNRKLNNNPLMGISNYKDDNKRQLDFELNIMLKKLLSNKEKINLVKDIKFKDLKKILFKLKDVNSNKELQDFLDKETDENIDKQTLLLALQKLYQIDFYLDKEKVDSLF